MQQADPELKRAAEALERLPQRRPASLYDVAVQYSILDWYQTITSDDLTFELAPEHLAFMTPLAKQELYDEPDNALVVYVDLSDPETPRFRDEQPVRVESIDRSQRYQLGHSYPAKKTAAKTDHSITTHKDASEHHLAGERDHWAGTNNIIDRFTGWAQSDAADRVIERNDVDDVWIIRALQQLGEGESALDELTDRPDFPLDPTDKETEREVFVTVRVKLPDEDEYRWPGEVPALNEVMVEQKTEQFESTAVSNAAGEGVGYVTGERKVVKGGSTGLLSMYPKKHREHFPDLSPDGSAAWRSRPITHTTAAAIATATTVFEHFYQGLGDDRRLYVLPYLASHPEQVSPAEFNRFATTVFERLREADATDFETAVNRVFFERDDADSDGTPPLFPSQRRDSPYKHVRVATAFTVSGNPDRVFFEATNTDPYQPLALENAHEQLIEEPPFVGEGVFADLVEGTDSPLLARTPSLRTMALFGSYFDYTTAPTRSSEESQNTPKAGDIDDVRARRLRQFLTNDRIAVLPLLAEYLHRIVQRQRDRFGQDGTSNVPAVAIVEQYMQLRALAAIGALDAGQQQRRIEVSNSKTPTYNITTVTSTNSDAAYESQAERLEAFIDSHAVLANQESRQAVFLLGGLVGIISNFQRHPEQDISSTLVRRYPIDYLTKQSIKGVTNEVLQMANTYADAEEYFPAHQVNEYTRRLPDLMLTADPNEWTFRQSELQWLYALGIAFGSNDIPIDTEE